MLEIRDKLKSYSVFIFFWCIGNTYSRGAVTKYFADDALLLHTALLTLPSPSNSSLRTLRAWLEGGNLGDFALIGEDNKTWGSSREPQSHAFELVAIRPEVVTDKFSFWVCEYLVGWFYYRFQWQGDVESGSMAVYNMDVVLRYTSYMSTAIASLLPIISIIVLYFLKNRGVRLGVATFIFVNCLMIFTRALYLSGNLCGSSGVG